MTDTISERGIYMRTKRIDEIEQYIIQEKSVSLDTLCDVFQVSKNTIRRDIDTLAKTGKIKKVYGGVISMKHFLPKSCFHLQNATKNIWKKKRRSAALPQIM